MPPNVLPGFSWSKSAQRYRSDASGKFTSRQDIISLMESQVNGLESRLGALAQAVADGNLAPAYFAEQARTELRRAHLQQISLAVGGWERISSQQYGKAGQALRQDYARVIELARGLQDGAVTLPQAMNRVQGWAGNARLQFFAADKDVRNQAARDNGMALLMIRDLGTAEHCLSCVDYYQRGYQPDLPAPGTQSECGTHCRCGLRYREVPAEAIGDWIGTRRQ